MQYHILFPAIDATYDLFLLKGVRPCPSPGCAVTTGCLRLREFVCAMSLAEQEGIENADESLWRDDGCVLPWHAEVLLHDGRCPSRCSFGKA